MWNGLSMWRLLLCLAWMWETNKFDGFGDKVEGGRDDSGPKLFSVSSYISKWSFISVDHQHHTGVMGCLVALDLDLSWQCCLLDIRISFLSETGWWILTWHIQAILYSQGAISFVWVLIFRKYHVWAGWNCAYSWVAKVCCRASSSRCAYRYVVQITTIATKSILYSFLLEGPQIPLLSLPDTTVYSFSSIASTLSSISSWWIISWCFLHPLKMSMNPSITSQQDIKSVWSSQILSSPKWKWTIIK
jgi:hypothetical protein